MALLIITVIFSLGAIVFVRKQITLLEMYTTSLFATIFATLGDLYLDVKLNWYGFFRPGVDWKYIPILLVVYPAFNIVYLNLFPFGKSLLKKAIYILIISFITTGFEYIAMLTEVFYHKQWKLSYSFISYFIIYFLLYWNLLFIRRLQ
ncbi:CBO0543 family protein [Bacillus andreraoultii]|uniref:CBO0543 family protein n=1 Tax=Bacillus andreraoultii TaxID=1499685 RepID=UPI0005AA9C36|nr:CBO0543 family protein [Bacillus andreraoultii]